MSHVERTLDLVVKDPAVDYVKILDVKLLDEKEEVFEHKQLRIADPIHFRPLKHGSEATIKLTIKIVKSQV